MWTNVIDGLPSVPDSRMGGSDEVLCQDSAGNTFLGFVRRALDGTSKPYWTQSGGDWSCLEGIVRWVYLREVLEIIDDKCEHEKIYGLPEACECDNTHKNNNVVCRWCWANGRRKWDDPERYDHRTKESRRHLAILELLRKRGGSGGCPEKHCPGALMIDGACTQCGDTWANNILDDVTGAFADGLEFENMIKNVGEDKENATDVSPESVNLLLLVLEGTRNLANNEISHEELLKLSREGVIGKNIQRAMDMISSLSAVEEDRYETLYNAAIEAVDHISQANWHGRDEAAKRYLYFVATVGDNTKSLDEIQDEINSV